MAAARLCTWSADLSVRETDVLRLMAGGWSNGEIARLLFISEETVKTHVRKVLSKLDARNRSEAVAVGMRKGLIS